MKHIKTFLIVFALIILQLSSLASDYVYKKLPSGQSVIIKEIKDNPIVTINTWVKTGSINEDDNNSGVAHFLEHLFFKGSKNVPTGQFDKLLESKGGITNASTSKDFTQFYITIPSSEFNLALKLHSDMLLNPLIPEAELEKERPVVIEEISRGLDNPSNILYQNLFKLIYSTDNNHPYKRPVIGTKEVISTIKRESILDFYKKWYVPSNMITIVTGDIDSNYAMKEIEKAFIQNGTKPNKKNYPIIKEIKSPLSINEEKDVNQGYMAIAYKAPKFEDKKEAYALDILSVILGGSKSSILNNELKEKKQLVNSISSSYSQYLDDGLFLISATFKPENINKIKEEINKEIQKIKTGAITIEQVNKAKNILKTDTEYSRESVENIASELGFFSLYFNTPKMYDEYLKRIDSVNLNDVIQAANKYLLEDKYAISTVMPKGFVEISNNIGNENINDNCKVINSTSGITKYLLDNKSTLIVKQNKSNSIVAIDIYAKGGSHLQDKVGVSYLTSQNIKRGTKNYTMDEIDNYLDENGIKISFTPSADGFNTSLLTTKDNLNDALNLLDELINNATFPDYEIQKTVKNYKEYASTLKDRPLSYLLDKYQGLAYNMPPYSINSDVMKEKIDDVTKDDIINYYNTIFDSKNIIISVVGDTDEKYLIQKFNNIFKDKGLKETEVKDYLKNSNQLSENIQMKYPIQDKQTSWIIIGYKTMPIYNLKEVATLKIIDSILGSGMSSRLFQSLRENMGLAYQVGSQIQQYGNDGSFITYIGTNSANEKKAILGIEKEFEKLKTQDVSDIELKEAKEKLLGNIVLALETNMDRAELYSKYSLYGYDIDFLDKLKAEINNVTKEDIKMFACKYFNAPHIEVVAGK